MAETVKQRTIRLYNEKKQKEKEKAELIKKIEDGIDLDDVSETESNKEEEIQKKIPKKTNSKNEYSSPETDDDSGTEYETDDSLLADNEEADELLIQKPPYFYIDYDEGNIQLAKNTEYETLLVNRKDGLTEKHIKNILSNKLFDLKKTHLIINCWKVLTKSNLNVFSFDCTEFDSKSFEKKMENKIKWGSKQFMKERLTIDEKRDYTPFRDGVMEMLKSLYHHGVKIFIVSNSDFSFLFHLFKYYKLDKYIEAFFTPSQCGLPSGRLTHHPDTYSDRRKISKERVFICIERYVGRLPFFN